LYAKIDAATNNQYSALRKAGTDAQKMVARANSVEDLQKAEQAFQKAKDDMNNLLKNAKGVSPEDVARAKKTWRAQMVLNEIHSKIDRTYAFGSAGAANAANLPGAAGKTVDVSQVAAPLRAAMRLPEADLKLVFQPEDITALHNSVAMANHLQDVAEKTARENMRAARASQRLFPPSAAVEAASMYLMHHPVAAFGLPAVHALFTYPELGAPVFGALGRLAQPAAQVMKQSPIVFNLEQDESQFQQDESQ
jgi:hypothetical protein